MKGVSYRAFAALMLFAPMPASADSLNVHFGGIGLRGQSSLWVQILDNYDVSLSDLAPICAGGELAIELQRILDLAFAVDYCSSLDVESRYRHFVREDRTEIQQTLFFRIIPINFGLRLLPLGRLHAFVPYVSGGFGLYAYEYNEKGEFIDFETSRIFGGLFRDRGLGTGFYGGGGLEYRVKPSFFLFTELRRHFVDADNGDDFESFGDFDLDGYHVYLGIVWRR